MHRAGSQSKENLKMHITQLRILATLGGLLAGTAVLGRAQSAQITGLVTDSSEAVIVDADLATINENTGVRHKAKTNEAGYYTLPLLQPGKYRLTVQAQGFKPVTRTDIVLETGKVVRIDFVLEVGQVTETVTVSGAPPLLDTESAGVGQFVESKTVLDMPLDGRRIEQLVATTGTAVFLWGSRLAIAGGRGGGTNWLVDGGTSSPPLTEGLEFKWSPPVAEVQEFRVLANAYSAEYGLASNGTVTVTTRAGTNSFHGSAYEYVRNDKFDARNFFSTGKPPLRFNQFGFTVGGPVVKDRTFFFTSTEWQRSRIPYTHIGTVPTDDFKRGDFSKLTDAEGNRIIIYDPATTRPDSSSPSGITRTPFSGNVIPQTSFDPVGARLAAFYPSPNRQPSSLAGGNNFGGNRSEASNPYFTTIRIDHVFNEKNRLFGRFRAAKADEVVNSLYPEAVADPDAYIKANRHKNLLVNYAYNFTPAIINEATFQVRDTSYRRGQDGLDRDWPAELGLQGVLTGQYFPVVRPQGYNGLGFSIQDEIQDPIRDYEFADKLMWFRGAHSLKLGGEARFGQFAFVTNQYADGYLGFSPVSTSLPGDTSSGNSIASMLLGAPREANLRATDQIDRRIRYFGLFVQDDWRARSNLTLNIGLRWETTSPPWDANNRMSSFDFNAINPVSGTPGVVTFLGRDGRSRYPYDWNYANFGPRFGFAWRPFGSSSTVIRSGYAVFFGHAAPGTVNSFAGFSRDASFSSPDGGLTAPFLLQHGFPAMPAGEPLGAGFGAVPVGQGVRFSPQFLEENRNTPYNQQWNLSIQRELGGNTMAEIAYIGNVGHKLEANAFVNVNQVPPDKMGSGNAQLRRPFPQFGGVYQIRPTWGNSNFHAFNLKVEKRFSNGLNFLGNYTFSKFIDDVFAMEYGITASSDGIQNYYDRNKGERGLSGNDVRSRFVWSSVWETPLGVGRKWLNRGPLAKIVGGWNIGAIITVQSGFPFGVVTINDQTNAFLTGLPRMDVVGDPRLPESQRTVERWFNTAAFKDPAPYTFGNAGRDVMSGPGLVNVDMSLIKNVRWGERYNLQLRMESFNLPNHANFRSPVGYAGIPPFGALWGTRNPRNVQLGAQFEF
jgi:hypothetical protein